LQKKQERGLLLFVPDAKTGTKFSNFYQFPNCRKKRLTTVKLPFIILSIEINKEELDMEKLYKVQQTITLKVETEITASSKAEAKWLLEQGAGDFDEGLASSTATFKVLHEIDEPMARI
jgi:hypothetical protein